MWKYLAVAAAAAAFIGLVYLKGERAGGAVTAGKLGTETQKVIEETTGYAEDFRALRRACVLSGGVWDFAAGRCKKTGAAGSAAGR
jgi:hypothetical protein